MATEKQLASSLNAMEPLKNTPRLIIPSCPHLIFPTICSYKNNVGAEFDFESSSNIPHCGSCTKMWWWGSETWKNIRIIGLHISKSSQNDSCSDMEYIFLCGYKAHLNEAIDISEANISRIFFLR